MIDKKEDLVNTYIVNDLGLLRDLYLSKCGEFGIAWVSGKEPFDSEYGMGFSEIGVTGSPAFLTAFHNKDRLPETKLHLSDLIDLENSKVYTTDLEVIRKYTELCGREFFDQQIPFVGVFNSDTANSVYNFQDESPVDKDGSLSLITAEQIKALHAEKFGQTEAPEEKEVFDVMTQSHKFDHPVGGPFKAAPPEWDGKGLPPIGCKVIGTFSHYIDEEEWIIDYITSEVGVYTQVKSGKQFTFDTNSVLLRKPETPEQKAERERLEAAIELHDVANLSYYDGCLPFNCGWDSAGDKVKNMWLSIVDKTGYRK